MDSSAKLDESACVRIFRIGGNELVGELIALFLSHSPLRIADARAALKSGDLKAVTLAAHSLKSSCANIGAVRMREQAVRIERLAGQGDAAAIAPLLGEIEEEFARVRPLLEARRTRPIQLRRIAVVEDNPDNRLLVRAILGDLYEVHEYETGPEALEGLRKHRPDLVLLDVSLPGIDGPTVLSLIRSDDDLRALPVIALTAHAMAGDREKLLAAGFDDYVAKPIMEEDVLLGAIAKRLR